jgi:hypothetical protein
MSLLTNAKDIVTKNPSAVLLAIVILICFIVLMVGMFSDGSESVSYSKSLAGGSFLVAVTGVTILAVNKLADKNI